MSSKLKRYNITKDVLESSSVEKGVDSDFKKYSKEGKSSTWFLIEGDTMKFLTQLNSKGDFFAGFMPEPYLLFLSQSNLLNDLTEKSKNGFQINVEKEFKASDNFNLKILNQEHYNRFIINKISSVVFLIMAMESFINNLIPDTTRIPKGNKIDTKLEIEKTYGLREKFRQVIPVFKKIGDLEKYQNQYSKVLQLGEIRNSFIHLKTSNKEADFEPYLKDFEHLMTLNLRTEYDHVKSFIDDINEMKNASEQQT